MDRGRGIARHVQQGTAPHDHHEGLPVQGVRVHARLQGGHGPRIVLGRLAPLDDQGVGDQRQAVTMVPRIAADVLDQGGPGRGHCLLEDDEGAVLPPRLLARKGGHEVGIRGREDVHGEVDGILVRDHESLDRYAHG